MAADRLAALGDMFLNSFDDARREDGRNAVLRAAQRKLTEADDDIEENSTSTGVCTDDGDNAASDSSREPTASGPEVFEFDSKAVRPQGMASSRQPRHSGSGGSGGVPIRSRGGTGVTGTPATAASDPVSTWTGSRSELSSLQRQVQTYGAAALDKKAKKQFDATELAKLGARADKAQRMPASVGKGLKRKHTHRAERVQEEAVEAGHLSRQAIAKVRRKQKAAGTPKRDAGLGEHGSAFRRGVLRVSGKPPSGRPRAKVKQQRRV